MSGTKRFTQIDESTGEVTGSFVAVVQPKRKSAYQRHFTMNQNTLIALANNLSHEQLRVLLALFANLDYENYILIEHSNISSQINMLRPNVSRAIKNLVVKEILLEGPKIGRNKSYRLNPNYGWKGSVATHDKVLKSGFEVINGGLI